MKRIGLFLTMSALCFSCIRPEEPNTEADIETCIVLDEAGKPCPHIKGNVVVTNDRVVAQATPLIDLTKLALQVTLTEGATIAPDPKELMDYSRGQRFTVTSEDGEWSKEYRVSIDTFDLPTTYRFEDFELVNGGKYYNFFENVKRNGIAFRQDIWASGNGGFGLVAGSAKPEAYPTTSTPNGKSGKGVRLETKTTGELGVVADMPIAAGNLFIGTFDVANAMKAPMESTRFGLPFAKKPARLKGWFKYKRGETLTDVADNGEAVPIEGEDTFDIYAVLYESGGLDQGTLDGANVLTSPNIVALARVDNTNEAWIHPTGTDLLQEEYIPFDVEFEFKKPFDPAKSKAYGYSLAVVFTSSVRGATFIGAVGSELYVDEVEVVCE